MPDGLAIIVGSGFDERLAGCSSRAASDNEFGTPSSPLFDWELAGQRVVALARHGLPHAIPPHRINYRANTKAFADAGVTSIVALNTVGAVTSQVAPGGIAAPDQIIDYTCNREHTFVEVLGHGEEHIDFTLPFSGSLRQALLRAAVAAEVDCHDGGVYAATQGPRLETAAEIVRLERDGADFVGMTAMPEAALAAELGIAYACLALVVNHAAGKSEIPIHAELGVASGAARRAALAVIERYLGDVSGAAA